MPNIEEIIREAMEEGAFDNLPGSGKPLNIEDNPYVDPSWQLAYHLLKENGFALSFIEVRQAIDSEHAAVRAGLARAWEWHQAAVASNEESRWIEAEWQKAVASFKETVAALNKRIADYNVSIPLDRFYREKINVSDELARLRG
ncbi:MAG: DUF1992 domain-containing protein [Anaerolineales bacterium]|nr:MAG: DUF1992 domain-containing protein [Anaerolineales bacterium]